jgi:60kDa lysophospholipase
MLLWLWLPLYRFSVATELCPDVATMRLFPGITERTIRNFLQPPIRGCVLETFGTGMFNMYYRLCCSDLSTKCVVAQVACVCHTVGNAPDNRQDFLAALKEASERGVVIVNITQCTRGGVSAHYAAGLVCNDLSNQPMTRDIVVTAIGNTALTSDQLDLQGIERSRCCCRS